MMGTWPPVAFAAVDTETTDKTPETARVVEICLALILPGREPDIRTQIVNPGIPVPEEAARIHGITTERAEAEGKPPAEVLDVWVGDIALAVRSGLPLVIQNAPYDLTVLDRDCRRHGVPTLSDRLDGRIAPVLDPLVLDKQLIKRRRRVSDDQGARCLKTLAQVYGVPWDDARAHGAEYDCMQAARVVWRMGQWSMLPLADLARKQVGPTDPTWLLHRNDVAAFKALVGMDLMQVHEAQIGWYAEQSENFAQYLWPLANELRHTIAKHTDAGDDEQRAITEQELAELETRIDSLDGSWPIRPLSTQGAAT